MRPDDDSLVTFGQLRKATGLLIDFTFAGLAVAATMNEESRSKAVEDMREAVRAMIEMGLIDE